MESPKIMTKYRLILLLVVLFILLMLWAVLTQPFFAHRLATKIFTYYEIYLLKYPDSHLVETEITATSKVTMATHYTYHTSDYIDTVQEYMDQQLPGYVHMVGSRVIKEPTFTNRTSADETAFRNLFQKIGKGAPCIEVNIYPSVAGGTFILISEHWSSMGFPAWLLSW